MSNANTHETRQEQVQELLQSGAKSFGESRSFVQQVVGILHVGFQAGDAQQTIALTAHVVEALQGWHGINADKFLDYVNHHAVGFKIVFSKKKGTFTGVPVKSDDPTGLGAATDEGNNWYDFTPVDRSADAPKKTFEEKVQALIEKEFKADPDYTVAVMTETLGVLAHRAYKIAETKPQEVKSTPVAVPSEL